MSDSGTGRCEWIPPITDNTNMRDGGGTWPLVMALVMRVLRYASIAARSASSAHRAKHFSTNSFILGGNCCCCVGAAAAAVRADPCAPVVVAGVAVVAAGV